MSARRAVLARPERFCDREALRVVVNVVDAGCAQATAMPAAYSPILRAPPPTINTGVPGRFVSHGPTARHASGRLSLALARLSGFTPSGTGTSIARSCHTGHHGSASVRSRHHTAPLPGARPKSRHHPPQISTCPPTSMSREAGMPKVEAAYCELRARKRNSFLRQGRMPRGWPRTISSRPRK
jgi:hypothetical protein